MTTSMNAIITKIVSNHNELAQFNDPTGTPEYHLKITNAPYMPLVIERLFAPDHGCLVVSVAHYYTQNGDAMRDPEMCFDFKTWEPLYFLQDNMGIEQYVYQTPARKMVCRSYRHGMISFQATWARNLHEQGFTAIHRTNAPALVA